MHPAVYVGLGGFCGASARYLLSVAVLRATAGTDMPYGTLVCNVLGCFVIGTLVGLDETRGFLSDGMRLFLLVGVLGGFTTFSTFGLEAVELARRGVPWLVVFHVAAHVLIGLAAVVGGFRLARLL